MQLTPPTDLASGERALAITPRPSPDVGGWARRLRFWAGRTLGGEALDLESRHRASTLALAATWFAPGVVAGLEVSAREDRTSSGSPGDPDSDWWLVVRPGQALAAGGEDVALPRALHVSLDALGVIGDPTLFGGEAPTRARGLGIVVLEPVMVTEEAAVADPGLTCSDPGDDAFADRVVSDACRLAWHPWPAAWLSPPARGPRFRNLLANRLFAWEADNPDQLPPWHRFGVPLACLDVSSDGNVQFVDRHLVARAGGGAPPLPLLPGQGHPALWQARIRQFADHLADLAGAGLSPQDAEARFQFLPPFATIPRGLVDLVGLRTDFLPPTCRIQAVPLPQEQLELLLGSVAGLAPLDLVNGDECTIYVPVPQRLYDPRLLFTDSIDPAFIAAVQQTAARVDEAKARRAAVRAQGFHVRSALDRTLVPTWPDEDPAAVPGEPEPGTMPEGVEPEHDYAQDARDQVAALGAGLKQRYPFLAAEVDSRLPLEAWDAEPGTAPADAAHTFAGLQDWIDDLDARIRRGNDAVNYGFLRAQSDIYRVRQLMVGNVEATRLAVSPALAAIAQGESARATQDQLGTFFKAITASAQNQIQAQPKLMLLDQALAPAAPSTPAPSGGSMLRMMDITPQATVEVNTKVLTGGLLGGGLFSGGLASGGLASGGLKEAPKATLDARALFGQSAASTGLLGLSETPAASESDITGKRALVGKIPALRTTTMVDRLTDPPAPEAKNGAVASRLQIIADIVRLHPGIDLGGVSIPVAQHEIAVFPKPWLDENFTKLSGIRAELSGRAGNPDKPLTPGEQQRLTTLDRLVPAIDQRAVVGVSRTALWLGQSAAQLRRDLASELPDWNAQQTVQVQLTDPDLIEELGRGLYDPDPENGDEGGFYSAAVGAQELAMAALRAVEGRIDGYERALAELNAAAAKLGDLGAAWRLRLQQLDNGLAEARHDLSVADALRDEEQARIDALNQRRADTLANHVSQLVVARSRSTAAVDDLPELHLDQAWSDPLPAALADTEDLPDELERAVTAWRHAPVAWFTTIRALVGQLDRRESLQLMVADAKLRAVARIAAPPPPLPAPSAAFATATAVQRLLAGWQDLTVRRWQATAAIDLAPFTRLGWQESERSAAEHLSLDDLCAAGGGRAQLARNAGEQLSRIAGAAGALYRYAGQVPVAIRLDWAESISVFDRVVDLHDLAWLPGFAKLGRELRRDMQRLVTWLFAQVDSTRSEGLQLATDLVRVAVLLACHAPVGALITGRLTKPATIKGGDRLQLAIDLGAPRLGSAVRLYAGDLQVARAVVEDLGAGSAQVKVVTMQTATTTLTLASGTRAVFE
jgi:hypothetical protein